jgi:hypothetical protein
MNTYHDKMNRITELGVVPKTLSVEGQEYLKKTMQEYMVTNGNDLDKLLPFIIGFVYNEAYRAAVNDVLEVLRDRSVE